MTATPRFATVLREILRTQREHGHSCVTNGLLLRKCFVKRSRTVFAVFMLAIWVPATSHALMEAVGMIHQQHADADSDSDHDHDAADGICAVTSANAPIAKPVSVSVILYVLSHSALINFASDETRHFSFAALGPSPPLLPKSWQFVYRAALPGRAPSFLS